jgi:CII-binding regulator of phage lambda lysogenization HflD
MVVGDKEDFAMISFVGDIDLDAISKLGSKVNINGSEHLKDLEKIKKNK